MSVVLQLVAWLHAMPVTNAEEWSALADGEAITTGWLIEISASRSTNQKDRKVGVVCVVGLVGWFFFEARQDDRQNAQKQERVHSSRISDSRGI
mgnify:FL=1